MNNVPVDSAALKARFKGLEEVFPVALESFNQDVVVRIKDIREALKTQDLQKVQAAAHSIKGMVGEFQAESSRSISDELEQKAKNGQFEECKKLFEVLSTELNRLQIFLSAINPEIFFRAD